MVSKCQDCGQDFLTSSEYKHHQQTHLQTHLDKWSNKEESKSYPPPQGLNPALYKVLEYSCSPESMKALKPGKYSSNSPIVLNLLQLYATSLHVY